MSDGSTTRPTGGDLHRLIADLYPICRSITGDGVGETLNRIGEIIPLDVHDVPSGTEVLDWTVPPEWNIREAWVRDASGKTVVDFRDSNLHVVGYSAPIERRVTREELVEHAHTLPDWPDRTPYRTSYYDETWGFCMPHRLLEGLSDPEYDVYIDSSLESGSLTYGECRLPGESDEVVLVSCHVCHPSLCNDNLSGIAVAAFLASELADRKKRYTYRFVFLPGTIGSITWLAQNAAEVHNIRHGFVLAGVGDAGRLNYKRSRQGRADIDRAVEHVLTHSGADYGIEDFSPYGYDERQYCSPGYDLPIGCLMRSPWGTYPEYHTSADDLDFVLPDRLADSLDTCLSVVDVLEGNGSYQNLSPQGEPQLGRRGLYDSIGGRVSPEDGLLAVLWVLNLSDGNHDLLAIAERAELRFDVVRRAADLLEENGLLEEVVSGAPRSHGAVS
jgi:aminopeptidase-like protein